MKTFSFAAILAGALSLFALPASAIPIHATFGGTVNGSSGLSNTILNEFPIGTAASFDVTFDDSGLVSNGPVTDYDLSPVSGWVRLGSMQWALDAGFIWSYTYTNDPGNPILGYGLQLTGTGPILGQGASLFGLFLSLTPTLDPYGTNPFSVGFGYPVPGGTYYSYAGLSGTFSNGRMTSVPEPATASLFSLAALLLIGYNRLSTRKRPRSTGGPLERIADHEFRRPIF